MTFMVTDGLRLSCEDTGRAGPAFLVLDRPTALGSDVRALLAVEGHSSYFGHPDLFNREVSAFLEERRP